MKRDYPNRDKAFGIGSLSSEAVGNECLVPILGKLMEDVNTSLSEIERRISAMPQGEGKENVMLAFRRLDAAASDFYEAIPSS